MQSLTVKIKKLYPDSKLPYKKSLSDAAWDLYANNKTVTNDYIEYGTGVAIEIPNNYVGLVFPRSSVSNRDLILKNSVGVIDPTYRGEIKVRFWETRISGTNQYEIGERVAQILIIPFPEIIFEEVANLSETERNSGGFGSTGA